MTCCMPTEVFGFNLRIDWLKSVRQKYAVLAKRKYSDVPDKQLQHAIQHYSSLQGAARVKAFYSSRGCPESPEEFLLNQ